METGLLWRRFEKSGRVEDDLLFCDERRRRERERAKSERGKNEEEGDQSSL